MEKAQSALLSGDNSMEKNEYEIAARFYTKAIELNPDLICGHVYRATAYFKLNKNEDACKDVKAAEDKGCDRPEMVGYLKKCEE